MVSISRTRQGVNPPGQDKAAEGPALEEEKPLDSLFSLLAADAAKPEQPPGDELDPSSGPEALEGPLGWLAAAAQEDKPTPPAPTITARIRPSPPPVEQTTPVEDETRADPIDTDALHAAWMAEAARHLGSDPLAAEEKSVVDASLREESFEKDDDALEEDPTARLASLRALLGTEQGIDGALEPGEPPAPPVEDPVPAAAPLAEALVRRPLPRPGVLHRFSVGTRLTLMTVPGLGMVAGATALAHHAGLGSLPLLAGVGSGLGVAYGLFCWGLARSITAPLNTLAEALSGASIEASPSLLPGLSRRDRLGAIARSMQDYRLTSAEQTRYLLHQSQAAKAYLSAVLEGNPDAIVTMDERGTIVGFNPAAEEMFGLAAAEAVGRPVSVLMPGGRAGDPETRESWFSPQDENERHNPVRRVMAQRADKSVFPVELVVQEVRRENASNILFVIFLRDQTPFEDQARERDHIRRLADDARGTHAEVLNVLANELTYPVEAMNGALSGGRLDLEQLSAGLGLINAIATDLRGFANLESGLVDLNFAPVDVRLTCERARNVILDLAQEFGLALTVRIAADTPQTVLGDEALLETVLANFLECATLFNALDPTLHSSQPGAIALEVRRSSQAGRLRFEVGCDAKAVARTNLHTATRRRPLSLSTAARQRLETGGRRGRTGLILVISKRLVQLMRGTIGMTTWPGRGTTLWFELDT